MEDIEDNNDNDANIIKKFLLEISGKFKSNSTVEFSDYQEALESFNQQYKTGKNLILYEVHKSTLDGSVIKKVPVLNTSKHAERVRALEEEAKANALTKKEALPSSQQQQSSSSSSSNQKNKMTFANMKYKIIILSAVVAGLIVTLFMLNFLASGGGSGGGGLHGHMIAYESIQNYLQTSTIGIDLSHHKLIGI